MPTVAKNHPMHPFAEFFDLISMKSVGKNFAKREKLKVVYVEPNNDCLQSEPVVTNTNHYSSDQDPWDEKAQTLQFAKREFGK